MPTVVVPFYNVNSFPFGFEWNRSTWNGREQVPIGLWNSSNVNVTVIVSSVNEE